MKMQNAVDEAAAQDLGREYTELANAKVEAEANSKALRAKLAVLAQFALRLSDDSLNPLNDHVQVRVGLSLFRFSNPVSPRTPV